jgi:hypothetical protein
MTTEALATGTMVRNILKVYRSATDAQIEQGMTWYNEAHALAVELDADNPLRAAGIIAALSPRVQWSYNVKLARRAFAERGEMVGGGLSGNLAKANAIYHGADVLATLKAPKTMAFAATIADPAEPTLVVVDRHAVSVALGRCSTDADTNALSLQGRYELFADAYRRAAKRAGISPAEMQATTWVVWRQTAIRTAKSVVRDEIGVAA